MLHYVGLCNNTNQFNIQIKKMAEILQNSWNLSDQELDNHFLREKINKGFNKLADKACLELFKFLTSDLVPSFQKKDFLKLDLEVLINNSLENKK